jgi:anti-sigma28 factor (negative regulator of flagellin synthesis)
MSDTRILSIVRDAAAPTNTSTLVVISSTYNGKVVRPEQRPLRAQQVNRLRQAIVRGDYQADPRRIAMKLLKRS